VQVWVLCTSAAPAAARAALQERGVEIMEIAADGEGRVDVAAAARALGERGLHSRADGRRRPGRGQPS